MANNFLPLQAQPFTLAGSGAVSGATSVTLTSFYQIDGTTAITMAMLGTVAYMTLEPGNGTQEEQISFSGVTANANGTFTLTGVKTVLFVYPYTETSGLSKSHPGGVIAVLSNTAGFYNHFVNKDDDGTVNEVLTFDVTTGRPKLSSDVDTTVATELVDFGQLSRQAISGAANASTSVKGIVQIPSQSGVDGKTKIGSTGAIQVVTPDLLRATKYNDYVVDTGTVSAYAIAPSPVVTQYVAGLEFRFKAIHTNAATPTLSVNGLTAKSLNYGKVAIAIGSIRTSSIVGVVYDGTAFQVLAESKPMISQESSEIYGTSTTGNTAYVVALSPVLTAYAAGLIVNFKPDTGGGHATLNVNSLGAKNIFKSQGGVLKAVNTGDILANQIIEVIYDGTQFQITPALPYNFGFGTWASASADGNAHQVTTDGILIAQITVPSTGTSVTILSDSANPPTTQRAVFAHQDSNYSTAATLTVPIKKNDYYKVVIGSGASVDAIYFLPLS